MKPIQFFFCLLLLFAGSQALPASFETISLGNGNGLSNSSVNCLFMDSGGLLWIGTWDGLNVYNGSKFVTYHSIPGNLSTITDNIIRDITEQRPGIMWIATDSGVDRIDTESGDIKGFRFGFEERNPAVQDVFSISVSHSGQVFASAAGWGLAWYDEQEGQMIPVNVTDFNTHRIKELYCIGENGILVSDQDGFLDLLQYEQNGQGVVKVTLSKNPLPFRQCRTSFKSGNQVFVSQGDSLAVFDTADGSFIVYQNVKLPGILNSAARASTGQLYLSVAPSSILVYDPEKGKLSPFGTGVFQSTIFTMMLGIEDILWVGTDGQGVIGIYRNDKVVRKVTNKEISPERNSPVRAFYKDRNGNLLVGTKGSGIYVEKPGAAPSRITVENGLSNNSVFCLSEGFDNDVFIGHDGYGLDVLSLKTGRISRIVPTESRLFGSVYSIYRDKQSESLWLGTYGYGLIALRLSCSNGLYTILEQHHYVMDEGNPESIGNNAVFDICPAPNGRLWLATRGGGLNLFDTTSGKSVHFIIDEKGQGISSNDILSLSMSRDSTLWIGTGYGLNKLWTSVKGEVFFEKFTVENGLPNNTVHGILEDRDGNLWLTTNRGLVSFSPKDKTFINFYRNNLFQTEFADGATYSDEEGRFYVGGTDGFESFFPEEVRVRNYRPRILINSVLVRQRPIPRSDFAAGKKLDLAHNDNFLTIDFSALEYIDNANCEYSYMLEGFNARWVDNGTNHTAVFTNIPPGHYIFHARCTNGDDILNPEALSLQIRIRRPWWSTFWAFVAYCILLLLAACSFLKFLKYRMNQEKRLELEKLSREQQEENYESKLRFFTNIAHEFGTPLTLICASSDKLRTSMHADPENSRYFSIIQNSAERMMRLIKELVEFRKVETGNRVPVFSRVNLPELARSIVDNFSEMCKERGILLETSIADLPGPVVSDRDALEKIIYNLLSNAFKYTPDGGSIKVNVMEQKNSTKISVWNSGKGIDPEDLERVFNRFSILDNLERQATKGRIFRNGIGLSLAQSLSRTLSGEITVTSTPGEHTVFTLELPHIPDSEIILEEPVLLPEKEDIITFEAAGTSSPIPQDAPTVMVVDDEEQIRNLVGDVLAEKYHVLKAVDGQDAIDQLKNCHADLIVTDLIMPRIDGLGLLKFLKSHPFTEHIPIIFLTFKSNIENEISSYEMGGEAFIPKPFHPRHLMAIVERILSNRTSLKEYFNSALSNQSIFNGKTIDADDKKFMMRLTSLVEDNLTDETLSPDFLCEKMLISRIQLYRKLKEILNLSPSEFIRNIKIAHAAHLLKTTKLMVQEIMYDSGFNNKSYFYREFTAKYHLTPKEFRNQETL